VGVYNEVIVDEFRRLGFNVIRGFVDGRYSILDVLSWIADIVIDEVSCGESVKRVPGEVAPIIRSICEKLGGMFASRQLNILEGITPKIVEALRINVMIKREELLMKRAQEKLREKANRLRDVVEAILHHYSKENRVQGFCSYCAKDVPKEIKDITKNLPVALRRAYHVGGVY
jgi:uncharacterized coiled-coil protein SlyX